jgi:hypothetical protein
VVASTGGAEDDADDEEEASPASRKAVRGGRGSGLWHEAPLPGGAARRAAATRAGAPAGAVRKRPVAAARGAAAEARMSAARALGGLLFLAVDSPKSC